MGGRAEARPRPRRTAAQRRQAARNEIPRAGAQLPRPHHGLGRRPRTRTKYREPFAPVMPDVEFVRFNDVADLRANSRPMSAPSASKRSRARAASGRLARSSSPTARAALRLDRRAADLSTRSSPAWAAPEVVRLSALRISSPTSRRWPSRSPADIPLGAMLCTEEAARAIHARHARHHVWRRSAGLRRRHRCASTPSKREGLLAHVTEIGDYFRSAASRACREARVHHRCARPGPDARPRTRLRRSRQAGRRGRC